MKKVVLITGANGMLARQLSKVLEGDYTLRFLSRKPTRSNEFLWDLERSYLDKQALTGVNSIIHLAGTSIASKRWNKKGKLSIVSSRVDSANLILEALQKHQIVIESFISASAVGFYGTTTSENIYNEDSPEGSDFLSGVCCEWENAAFAFEAKKLAKRVAIVRIGIILAKNDGALKKLAQAIKSGFGAKIGSGNQYMPWIYIQDLCEIFKHLSGTIEMKGVYNAVAPEHITNQTFTQSVAEVLHRKIRLPGIPKIFFRSLLGEKAIILLEGSRVSADKIVKSGFAFKYGSLSSALNDIFNRDQQV